MKWIICISMLMFVVSSVFSQDTVVPRKSKIAIVPTRMLNRSISVTYYFKLNPRLELTLKSGYRYDKKYKAYKWHNDVFSTGLLIQDPFWYYNKQTTQIGASFSSNQIAFIETA